MAGPSSLTCIRCQGTMERGFLLDETHGRLTVGKWMAGEPEKSIWTGLKTRGKDKLDVATYRCRRCGYLESYA
jgi:hypothetical protein